MIHLLNCFAVLHHGNGTLIRILKMSLSTVF
nr:MAG TPA: hypothetical protein [Caudoviricetes sp.]DAU27878.1 MAG TPA: hypothetical protein [Caudoviricetes sp.]DAZ74856.1 MAG TPA: hypothetical protein [Caudoviricetes sp.]